jgi:hypothetical protein
MNHLTIISVSVGISLVVLAIGGAIRLSRARVRETPVPRRDGSGGGDLHGELMQRLRSEIGRSYGPRGPRV